MTSDPIIVIIIFIFYFNGFPVGPRHLGAEISIIVISPGAGDPGVVSRPAGGVQADLQAV